jgi:hypothetical protein
MAVPRAVPAVLGTLAVLGTAVLIVLHIILAQSMNDPSSAARIAAIISSALETVVLTFLCWCIATHIRALAWNRWRRWTGVVFGVGALLCAVASATSVAALVCLSNVARDLPAAILGTNSVSFLIGASAALGLTFALQLVFLVVHFVLTRLPGGQAQSLHTEDDGRRSAQANVKSIPYSQTSPMIQKTRGSTSMDSRSPPGSSGGRSASETISSIRSSLSNVVRPISSKTRLLSSQRSTPSQRSGRRPASLDSNAHRDTVSAEDGFDSWDTSAVDPQTRQTVLDTSSPTPGGRFLETIPASPTTSRSPSPGTPLDLEPPRTRRSRSYSPAASRTRAQRSDSSTQPPSGESHIHPLFRSDSPTPPPAVSAGTVVTAAPNAGQVISDRQSLRSLNRMRSGSLPAVPSPLSRQGSFDDFGRTVSGSDDDVLEEGDETASEATERKMTPPIPDIPEWILSAGSRTSLSGYNSRKVRIEDGSPETEKS